MSDCPIHPEKVQFDSLIEAVDELERRRLQPRSHVRRPYKCWACSHWHFTSRLQARNTAPLNPFPRRFAYGVIIGDRRVWQSADQETAEFYAKVYHGKMVPFMTRYH